MIPYDRGRIEDKLLRWGYSRRMVEGMKPWRLLDCYYREMNKHTKKNVVTLIAEPNKTNETSCKVEPFPWPILSRELRTNS